MHVLLCSVCLEPFFTCELGSLISKLCFITAPKALRYLESEFRADIAYSTIGSSLNDGKTLEPRHFGFLFS